MATLGVGTSIISDEKKHCSKCAHRFCRVVDYPCCLCEQHSKFEEKE